MGRIAFIFPGQGSQTVGMGRALYESCAQARAVVDQAAAALEGELDLRALMFDGSDHELRLTANTQPALLTAGVAAHAALRARRPDLEPAFVAGHSLGEWSALVAAGAVSVADGVRAVRSRGLFMQEAVPEGQGTMAAVMGADDDAVHAACASASGPDGPVSAANFNAPGQTVIAGHHQAVERAARLLKELGARVRPLPVSAPFHCSLMEPVVPRLRAVLQTLELRAPTAPVVSNVEAAPVTDPEQIRGLLAAQVTAPVRWVESIRRLADEGVTHVVELGPGKVLGGLVKRIAPEITRLSVQDPQSLEASLAALEELR